MELWGQISSTQGKGIHFFKYFKINILDKNRLYKLTLLQSQEEKNTANDNSNNTYFKCGMCYFNPLHFNIFFKSSSRCEDIFSNQFFRNSGRGGRGKEERREKKSMCERHINWSIVCLPHVPWGWEDIRSTIQVCALHLESNSWP